MSLAKPFKVSLFSFAIIAILLCLLVAACGLRAAQKGQADAVLNAPPLPPGVGRETALREGREVARLIGQRKGDALFAKFTPQMAAAVPKPDVTQLLNTTSALKAELPTGEMIDGSETAPVYYALYPTQNGEGLLTIMVSFASARADKIAGLLLTPQTAPDGKEAALQQGRKAAALVAEKDTDGLRALFSPAMANVLPRSKIHDVLEQMITNEKLVGAKSGEIVVPASDDKSGSLAYAAEFAYGSDNTLKILMTLAPDNQKLTSLRLIPGLSHNLPADPHAGYQIKTHLSLPFVPGDKWTVAWGGDTRTQNYHVDYADQRHAFDILAMQNGQTHTGDGKQLSQYFAWGRKIVAPADATVIETVDGLPDNAPGTMDRTHAAGNHIVLDFGNNEYALLAHLQNGSVKVKPGQKIKTGDLMGLCGNSGNTSEPHLHFHVQDGPQLFHAEGLPVIFWNYMSNGKPVASGSPVQDDVIEAHSIKI